MNNFQTVRWFTLIAMSCLVLHATDFEGTLRWTMSIEITDPAMKKEMVDAEKQVSDPKMLAQMNDAQGAMADPEMQAMMAQNPQMKAMMEQQMAMINKSKSGSVNPFDNMFPKAFLLRTKAGKTLSVVDGGPMPVEVLNLPAIPVRYMIDRKAHTYLKLPDDKALGSAEKTTYKITKTNDSLTILGYACTKYVVVLNKDSTTHEKPSTYLVWASTEVDGIDTSALAKLKFSEHGSENAFMRDIVGVPLKMEVTTTQARVTMQAVTLQAESLADDLFRLPAGFTER